MKNLMLVCTILCFSFMCDGQDNTNAFFTYDTFESKLLAFEPKQREGVSENDFKDGLFKLNSVKNDIKGDVKNLNSADYWNITMAFVNFNEPKEHIEISFKKAIRFQENNIYRYIDRFGPSKLDVLIPAVFFDFYLSCSESENGESDFDVAKYCKQNELDSMLIDVLHQIKRNDSAYRKGKEKYYDNPETLKSQREMDAINQRRIDSLFALYNTYIGRSLAGKKYENVMWQVIQHSNVAMMEKYLPAVHEAYQEKEIGIVPLKLLIDRLYGLQYGYQIFGSQAGFGFELADEKTRKEIMHKYSIE